MLQGIAFWVNGMNEITSQLRRLQAELKQELASILDYWMRYTIDDVNGGFYGRISNENLADNDAEKGLVLHARILWTFSAAFLYSKDQRYLDIATRAFHYLIHYFHDQQFGGFYWAVNKQGQPVETKKQVYGIAFCCYGFSEYYRASGDHSSLDFAKDCYAQIEQHAFDPVQTGYLEAFTRDWQTVTDLRLSAKDANEKKTMNTHLHILEAYSNLYKSFPDEMLRNRIGQLLSNFSEKIIDRSTGHMRLYFDENWKVKSTTISFGHEIEASWLLPEAAATIGNNYWIRTTGELALVLAEAAQAGLDQDGGLWYELEAGSLIKQKHWWPQAEAMVGFFNAWQLSGNKKYLGYSIRGWEFIQQQLLDKKHGEWFWGVGEDGKPMHDQDKIGFWKCPYHNSRACLEIINRVNAVNGNAYNGITQTV